MKELEELNETIRWFKEDELEHRRAQRGEEVTSEQEKDLETTRLMLETMKSTLDALTSMQEAMIEIGRVAKALNDRLDEMDARLEGMNDDPLA